MESVLSIFTVMSVLVFWLPLFLTMLEWPNLLKMRRAPAKVHIRRIPFGYTHCHCCRSEDTRPHRAA